MTTKSDRHLLFAFDMPLALAIYHFDEIVLDFSLSLSHTQDYC